ncbi:hypothetical protein [Nocardia carnea]|uniref:hypothetical protein n=1 Tax=Nocardia carnea TaxID=37328 RepID=UPI00245469D3|nr:hypothetical protein [Nocardia carnea]
MSERPVEDEIMDEARRFGHSMARLMRMHAQANGWLEKRKVRREISLEMRKQRRTEQAERVHHKVWTAQMIHRYQVAAQARYERWSDPQTSREQLRRDNDAAARHIDELRERIVGNTRLTEVERGIALDCLESARMWPYKKDRTPEMLARAPKVRGLEALRYRAVLARETEWIQRRRWERETAQRDLGVATERQEPVWQHQIQPQQVGQEIPRPTGELDLAQQDAVQKIRHAVLENQPDQLRAAGDSAVRVGLTPQRVQWEMQTAEVNSKYVSEVSALRNGSVTTWRTYSPTEAEAAQWAAHNTRTGNWVPGVQLTATVRERGNQAPIRLADGGVEHVTDATRSWRDAMERPAKPQREEIRHTAIDRGTVTTEAERDQGAPNAEQLAEIEARIRKLADEQEKRDRKISVLQRSVDAVTADRDNLRIALDSAEARIERLQNLNRGLSVERDKYRGERDQAVQKLVHRTPEQDRLGSPERQSVQHEAGHGDPGEFGTGDIAADLAKLRQQQRDRGGADTQAMPREQLPTPPETNGHRPGRNGIERSR